MNNKNTDLMRGYRRACAMLCALLMLLPCGAFADAAVQPDATAADAAVDVIDDTDDGEGAYSYSYDSMSVDFISGELLEASDGAPALALYFDFTNSKSTAETFIYSFAVTLYQDGIECDPAYTWDFDAVADEAYNSLISIRDGATMRVCKYFLLKNAESPVDMEVGRMFSFGSTPMTITLALPDVTVASSSSSSESTQEIVIEFTDEEAEVIAAAALLEGKSASDWLHDIAVKAIGG